MGPLWGLAGTVIGMIRSFNTIANSSQPAEPEQLAGAISFSLYTTLAGLVACPVGIAILVFYAVRYSRRGSVPPDAQ